VKKTKETHEIILSANSEQEMNEWIKAFRKHQLDTILVRCDKFVQRLEKEGILRVPENPDKVDLG
jgi:hypothetical protein